MSRYQLLAQHELEDGQTLALETPRRSSADYRLVGHLAGRGLEIVWQFDDVDVRRNDIALSRRDGNRPGGRRLEVGSLEGGAEDYGAVGAALVRIARGLPAAGSDREAMTDV